MKKIVPDPPDLLLTDAPTVTLAVPDAIADGPILQDALLLTITQTGEVLRETEPGLRRDALCMAIRVMCAVLDAVTDHCTAMRRKELAP